MGRKNKSYSKSLHQQAYEVLVSKQKFGESKRAAKKDGTSKDKIFSFKTYETYWRQIKHFLEYIKENRSDCTTLKSARKYVNEYLESRERDGYSAWTIQTDAKALGKLFDINPGDKDYYVPPQRKRENIKRSRGEKVRDAHFSEENNHEFVNFCKATGLRRSEIEVLKAEDLVTKKEIEAEISQIENGEKPQKVHEILHLQALLDTRFFDEEYYIHIRSGKGGRERYSPVVGKNIEAIVERISTTPGDKKVWEYVSTLADIHSYRGDYATYIYKEYARNIEDIPKDKVNKGTGRSYQSEVYVCRKDENGKRLDKKAMEICSKALGHNRIQIVAENYIRGI